ncbi:alpha/beta hydrolase [Streptosporangium sp. NPDC049644]|uniref:alpha/beta fold hydrolase n=1 Tax=Streptosporangium sp. NPDC049644 TaxID=3155507 RepID=UPI0034417DF0
MPTPSPWSPFTAEHRLDDGDRPTVVFMSALFAGGWIWDHPYRRLESAGWPVLRTNEPICALDSKIVGSIERLGDVLLEVCDEAGVKDIVICANSLGGLVAIDLAGRFPERVRGIVVSGAPGLTPDPDVGLSFDRRASVQPAGEEFRDRMLSALFHGEPLFTEEQLEATATLLRHPPAMVSMARSIKATRVYKVLPAMDRVTCPSMYVWGEHDRMTPVDAWVKALAGYPQYEMVLVEGCGHIPMIERAEEYSACLDRFLAPFAEAAGTAGVPA